MAERLRPGTLLRLAMAGSRVDRARIVLTALSSAVATGVLLAMAAVLLLRVEGQGRFGFGLQVLNNPDLLPGVLVALAALLVPTGTLVGLCSRVGAPARDRRLSALRLAGASPSDVRAVVGAESAIAAVPGALLGLGLTGLLLDRLASSTAYVDFADLPLLHQRQLGSEAVYIGVMEPYGPMSLSALLVDRPWVVALAVLLVPVVAATAAAWAMRGVVISPLGVIRRRRVQPAGLTPIAVLVAGVALLASVPLWTPDPYASVVDEVVTLVSGLLMLVGVVLLAAPVSSLLGRLLGARTSSAALLFASRRMQLQPHGASRILSCVGLAALVGGGAAVGRGSLPAEEIPNPAFTASSNDFFAQSYDAVFACVGVGLVLAILALLVVQVESTLTRRRELASLVAAGTDRRTLARAALLETMVPLTPLVLISAAVGSLAVSVLYLAVGSDGAGPGLDVPVLVGTVLGCLLGSGAATALSLLGLRSATDVRELHAT